MPWHENLQEEKFGGKKVLKSREKQENKWCHSLKKTEDIKRWRTIKSLSVFVHQPINSTPTVITSTVSTVKRLHRNFTEDEVRD